MIKIYGIRTCDTVRKARKWLRENGIEHEYADFRADGLPEDRLAVWLKKAGWETLLNQRGMAWRKLAPEKREGVDNEAAAVALIREEPALIKRPVLEHGGEIHVGFKPEQYAAIFGR